MSDQQREVVARALRQHRPTKRVVGSVTYCVVCTCGWLDATGRERQEQHAADAALSALALTQPDPPRVTDEKIASLAEADRQWGEEPDLGDETPEAIWFTGFNAGHYAGAVWQAAQPVIKDRWEDDRG